MNLFTNSFYPFIKVAKLDYEYSSGYQKISPEGFRQISEHLNMNIVMWWRIIFQKSCIFSFALSQELVEFFFSFSSKENIPSSAWALFQQTITHSGEKKEWSGWSMLGRERESEETHEKWKVHMMNLSGTDSSNSFLYSSFQILEFLEA